VREGVLVLVTGGGGFIGQRVCSVLGAHGKGVVALDRGGWHAPAEAGSYHVVACDIRDSEQMERVFRQYGFGAVVHLASLLRTASEANPRDALEVNVMGSLNVLQAARRYGVPKVIAGSSISVYGSGRVGDPRGVTESEAAAPEDMYGVTKRTVEIVGAGYRERFGIQFTALRMATVLGPGGRSRSSAWRSEIFEKMGLPYESEVLIPYRGDEALPLVHVEDVADMVERLVDAEGRSFAVYNTPCETWKLSELALTVESLGGKLRIRFGESVVSGIPRVVDGGRFAAEFGYSAVSLRERLRRASQCGKAQAHG